MFCIYILVLHGATLSINIAFHNAIAILLISVNVSHSSMNIII